HLAGRRARGELRRLRRIEHRQRGGEAVADLAGLAVAPLGCELGARAGPRVESLLPCLLLCAPTFALVEVLTDGLGNEEVLLRVPAERLLRRGDLVGAERLAVRLRAAALVGRMVRDHRAKPDQRRPLLL